MEQYAYDFHDLQCIPISSACQSFPKTCHNPTANRECVKILKIMERYSAQQLATDGLAKIVLVLTLTRHTHSEQEREQEE